MKNAVLPEGLPSPAYILDETLLRRNLDKIRAVSEASGAEFILALKGFAMWSAFPIFNAAGFSKATASSPWEARLAMEEMGAPAHTYAPAYTNEEMEEVASMSSHITFNSLAQFRRFADKAKEINSAVSLGLRVNPELSIVETDLYNPCGESSRLGVRRSELPEPSAWPADLEGMHCHALCESSAADSAQLIQRFEEKFGDYLPRLRWVNFGGGHLVTRAGYDTETFVSAVRAFKARHPHLHVIFEPGSAFAWETGYLLCTVLDLIERPGQPATAIVNVSFTAHMPDCLEMPYKPQIVGAFDPEHPEKGVCRIADGETLSGWSRADSRPEDCRYEYRIGGNSCLAGDQIGTWRFDHALRPGEMLLFHDMIHYTMVKTTTFNGVKHPAVCIVKDGQLIYKHTFTYADYKGRLS